MTLSHSPGQNAHQTILALACERYHWDSMKMVLAYKQSRPITMLSAEAEIAFIDLGLIEPDQDNDGELKVSDDYESLIGGLTLNELQMQHRQKGAKKDESKKVRNKPRRQRDEDRYEMMSPPPQSGMQRIGASYDDVNDVDEEELAALQTA